MPSMKSILYAAVSILIVIYGFNFSSRKILIEIIPEHLLLLNSFIIIIVYQNICQKLF